MLGDDYVFLEIGFFIQTTVKGGFKCRLTDLP